MKITKKDLQSMINRLNACNGLENPECLTVGAYNLYHDGNGYAIHQTMNENGGVNTVGHCYGMTVKECYYFLSGLLVNA